MPPFVSIAELVRRVGADELAELVSREGTVTPDQIRTLLSDTAPGAGSELARAKETIDRALTDAHAEVMSYASGRLGALAEGDAPPDVLVRYETDVARFLLYERPTESVQKRYEAAVKWLGALSAGRATLGLRVDGSPEPVRGGARVITDGDPVFTRASLAGFTGGPSAETGGGERSAMGW